MLLSGEFSIMFPLGHNQYRLAHEGGATDVGYIPVSELAAIQERWGYAPRLRFEILSATEDLPVRVLIYQPANEETGRERQDLATGTWQGSIPRWRSLDWISEYTDD